MKANRVAKITLSVVVLAGAIGCGGENPDGNPLTTISSELEPLIPSCPACAAHVNPLNVALTGDFGTVLPSWVKTEMTFTATQRKATKLPVTGEHYIQSVGRTPFVPVTEAKMHFFYNVGGTEIESSKTLSFTLN